MTGSWDLLAFAWLGLNAREEPRSGLTDDLTSGVDLKGDDMSSSTNSTFLSIALLLIWGSEAGFSLFKSSSKKKNNWHYWYEVIASTTIQPFEHESICLLLRFVDVIPSPDAVNVLKLLTSSLPKLERIIIIFVITKCLPWLEFWKKPTPSLEVSVVSDASTEPFCFIICKYWSQTGANEWLFNIINLRRIRNLVRSFVRGSWWYYSLYPRWSKISLHSIFDSTQQRLWKLI